MQQLPQNTSNGIASTSFPPVSGSYAPNFGWPPNQFAQSNLVGSYLAGNNQNLTPNNLFSNTCPDPNATSNFLAVVAAALHNHHSQNSILPTSVLHSNLLFPNHIQNPPIVNNNELLSTINSEVINSGFFVCVFF